MPEAVADPIAALAETLKADGATAAIAGANVFGGELPSDDDFLAGMPQAAIVLEPTGGLSLTGDSYLEHDTSRVDLFAYGATPREAKLLADTAALALRRVKRVVVAGVLLHWVKPAGGATDERDVDAAWPRSFRSFQVFNSLTEV